MNTLRTQNLNLRSLFSLSLLAALSALFVFSTTYLAKPIQKEIILINVGIMITLLPAIIRITVVKKDIFEPSNMFAFFYCLSSFSFPMSHMIRGETWGIRIDLISPALIICIIGAVGFWIGYLCPIGRSIGCYGAARREYNFSLLSIVGASFIVVGLGMYIIMIAQIGIQQYLEAVWLEKRRLSIGFGTLAIGLNMAEIGVTVLFLIALRRRSIKLTVILIVLLMGFLALAVFLGTRRYMLVIIAGMVMLYHYRTRTLKVRKLFLGTVLIAAFLLSFSHFRGIIMMGWEDIRNFLYDEASFTWFDPADGFFRAPFQNLTTILEVVPTDIDYAKGLTYIQTPLVLIPSAIYSDRPETPTEWFAKQFYPNEYEAGGGRGFSLLSEAYLNFGAYFVFIMTAAFGIFLRTFYVYCMKNKSSFGHLFYSTTAPIIILNLVAIDFSSTMKLFLIHASFIFFTTLALCRKKHFKFTRC